MRGGDEDEAIEFLQENRKAAESDQHRNAKNVRSLRSKELKRAPGRKGHPRTTPPRFTKGILRKRGEPDEVPQKGGPGFIGSRSQ